MELDANSIFGLVSAGLAVLGAVASGLFSARTNRQAHELERKRRIETQQEAAARVIAHYRDPLLDAAHAMQGRLYNITYLDYFGRFLHCGDPDEERYARHYTLFTMAEYMCWAEIVRRELRFLDVGDVSRNRRLLAHLTQVQVTLQSSKIDSPFRVFRGRQRAIAELMMMPTGATEGPRTECMGYAAFERKMQSDAEFASWFAGLNRDIDVVAASDRQGNQRLAQLQNDLLDMIDFLDPDAVRIVASERSRDDSGTTPGAPAEEIPKQKRRRLRRRVTAE